MPMRAINQASVPYNWASALALQLQTYNFSVIALAALTPIVANNVII